MDPYILLNVKRKHKMVVFFMKIFTKQEPLKRGVLPEGRKHFTSKWHSEYSTGHSQHNTDFAKTN